MSNEITLEALLAQNAGTTIQVFTPDDRLTHTIENIRNGDPITEELLIDLKNRQDDINTIIYNNINYVKNIKPKVFRYSNPTSSGVIYDASYSNEPPTGYNRLNFVITLVKEDAAGNKRYESKGALFTGTSTSSNSAQIGVQYLFISKIPQFDYIYIYRWLEEGVDQFQFANKFQFEIFGTARDRAQTVFVTPTLDIHNDDLDNTIIFNGEIAFNVISNYTTLQLSRIQAGELVDGLDVLIQANEIDFNDRTQLILEYTKE